MKPVQREDELRHNYLKRVAIERIRLDQRAKPALAKAKRALQPKEGRS